MWINHQESGLSAVDMEQSMFHEVVCEDRATRNFAEELIIIGCFYRRTEEVVIVVQITPSKGRKIRIMCLKIYLGKRSQLSSHYVCDNCTFLITTLCDLFKFDT